MNLDRFLEFLFRHNILIIEGLFVVVLVAILFIAIRAFFFSHDGDNASAVDLSGIENSLKKILAQSKGTGGAVGAASSAEAVVPSNSEAVVSDDGKGAETKVVQDPNLIVELDTLKKSLKEKEDLIASLKTTQEQAQSAASSGSISKEDKDKFESRIKELEGKLAEYEIIEQDIADLSYYKEETVKLQKEIEKLKSTPPPAAVAPVADQVTAAPPVSAPAPAAPMPPASEPVAAPVVEQVAPAPTPAAAVEPPPTEAAEPIVIHKTIQAEAPAETAKPAEKTDYVDDALMAEFAAAVETQKAGKKPDVETSIPPVVAAPAASANPPPANPAPAEAAPVIDLNMDKMLSEAMDISKTDTSQMPEGNALESSLDADKLLDEANQFGNTGGAKGS